MALSLASNSSSVLAQGQIRKTNQALSKQFERLSSGLRINSASDDPAGLAMADALRADSKVASVAVRNATDGLSLTAIADSALGEIGNILSRMSELAEQSANGTYTMSQRSALQYEFSALTSEVDRIANSTEFNDIKLLTSATNISFQVGIDASTNSQITLTGINGTLAALGLANTGSSAPIYSIIAGSSVGAQAAATTALTALQTAIDSLSFKRGTFGAVESRLTYAVNFVSSLRDNFEVAESRIRDADVAQEVAEMVRLQVLQQAQTAVLAQANQQPSVALGLLQ